MFTLNCRGRLLTIDRPVVMGIINITPDSFYENSRKPTIDDVLRQTEKMLEEGASIIDIGGQSTRPGSEHLTAEEEIARVAPAITKIMKHFPEAFISIDTYYASVVKASADAGACIANDISGGLLDDNMLPAIASLRMPFVCMHMIGNPQNMQQHAHYENVTKDVLDFFIKRIENCRQAGINDVIIDPGFGFSKTIAHNFRLLKDLSIFKMLEKPLLVGLSRKSTVYKTLGTTPENALNGTTVLNTIGLLNGAHILRVHDVKEAVEVIKLTEAVSEL
ncbi:dihydropteroate synthase [Chitinophagaceae bacterium LWZ2-11]